MEKAVGVVRFRPAPDFDRLRAIMHEEPREVIAQGKHFLDYAGADLLTQARTYNLLCYTAACVLRRSTAEAVFHGHEAIKLSRQVEGVCGKAILFDSLVNHGCAAERIGEYRRAEESYKEALAMPLDWIGRQAHREAVLTYLGRALYCLGELHGALEAFDEAGRIAARRQDSASEEQLHNLRGLCHLKLGDLEQAERYLSMSAAITNDETRYELRPKSHILGSMAVLKALQGNWSGAAEYADAALEIAGEVEDPHGQVEGKMVLAICARQERRVQTAVELSSQAANVAFSYGYVPLIEEYGWLFSLVFPQRRG